MIVLIYAKTSQAFYQDMVLLSRELRRQIMNTHEYSSRPRLFVAISLLILITLLLAACGGPSTSGGSVTPTPGKTATLPDQLPTEGYRTSSCHGPACAGQAGYLCLHRREAFVCARIDLLHAEALYRLDSNDNRLSYPGQRALPSEPRSQPMVSG